MEVAASMSVGRLAPKHSLDIDGIRAISPNVTPSLIKDDIIFIDRLKRPDGSHMTIEEYTDQTFQPYIDQYNSKQRRKDRQIQTGYCEWHRSNGNLSQGKGELAYEAVLQYGSHDDLGGEYYSPNTTPERKAQLRAEYEQVYRQWVADLERDFPHMTVLFAVGHFSEVEGTPHLHVCMQPQADCTRGLAKQVSIGRALAQDGIERLDSRAEAEQAGGYQLARFYQRFHHEYQNPTLQRLGYEIKAEQHGLRHMEKDGYAVVMEQATQEADKIVQESRERAEITEKARKAAQKDLDLLETKQLLIEMELEDQQRQAAEASQTAEQARQAAERAAQQAAEAKATEAAIREQARYEAETTVRELQAQLWERDSIIHGLQAEAEKMKQKLSALREFLQERSIFENFLAWFKGKNQQQTLDEREL
ncbi:MAG: hypothetical protein J6B70_03145 [Oscillospiraceae bacterium]|nr:hypothetical protein [Oscillospiraceae bacterium]